MKGKLNSLPTKPVSNSLKRKSVISKLIQGNEHMNNEIRHERRFVEVNKLSFYIENLESDYSSSDNSSNPSSNRSSLSSISSLVSFTTSSISPESSPSFGPSKKCIKLDNSSNNNWFKRPFSKRWTSSESLNSSGELKDTETNSQIEQINDKEA